MIYMMMHTINSKIVVVLEGGYGVPEMCVTVECMLRVLLGEFFPNIANRKMLGIASKMSEYITQKFIDNAEEIFSAWGKYWPVLFDSPQMAIVKKYKSKIIPPGIAGGHVKNFTITPEQIIKKTKKPELAAYELIKHKYPDMAELFPKYYGYQTESDGTQYVIIENLSGGQVFNAMDLKLSSFGRERHNVLKFVHDYNFYSTGVQIFNEKEEILEQRRENSILLEEREFFEVTKRFFHHKNARKVESVVRKILQFLARVIDLIKDSTLSLEQVSLLVLYNPFRDDLRLRVIDLTYIEEARNPNILVSFRGIQTYFQKFIKAL